MEAAKKRLQKLQKAGFVRRFGLGVGRPSVFVLTLRARVLMENSQEAETGGAVKPPSVFLLRHEIVLRDFRIAVMAQAAANNIHVVRCVVAGDSLAFQVGSTAIRADGFIEVSSFGRVLRYFVEVDNGTESLSTLARRVIAYGRLFKSGIAAARWGGSKGEYRKSPFRVLFIFSSFGRCISALDRFGSLGIRDFVVGTVASAAVERPFDAIWVNPLGDTVSLLIGKNHVC